MWSILPSLSSSATALCAPRASTAQALRDRETTRNNPSSRRSAHTPAAQQKNSSSSGSKIMKLVLAALVGCAAALAPHPQHPAPRRAVLAAPLALLLPRDADAEPESDLQRAMREAAEKKVVEPRSHGK